MRPRRFLSTALVTAAWVTASLPASAQDSDLCDPPQSVGLNLIVGTPGDDVLVGTSGRDIICGLGGNDRIFGLDDGDYLDGGPGDDLIYGGGARDVIIDLVGNNTVHGGSGLDGITLGDGNDTVYGQGDGVGNIRAGAGNDVVWTGEGGTYDTVDAGPGDDQLYLNSVQRIGTGSGPRNALTTGRTTILMGEGNDYVQLFAPTPEDGLVINLGNGTDRLLGSPGDDHVILVDGKEPRPENLDEFIPSTIALLAGDDYLVADLGPDIVYGGPGDDLLIGDPIVIETNQPFRTVVGSSQREADHLIGGPGNDTLYGQGGPDVLVGQGGSDTLIGDNFPGNINSASGEGIVYVNERAMNDQLYAGDDDDYDYLDAGVGADFCKADPGDEVRRCEFPPAGGS